MLQKVNISGLFYFSLLCSTKSDQTTGIGQQTITVVECGKTLFKFRSLNHGFGARSN
jgi:hypothetical protein